MAWSDLAGARVGVWGVGVEGRASLARLDELNASVVVVDDRPAAEMAGSRPVLATALDGLERLATCEVVVKSPGISRYRPEVGQLASSGVAVTGGLALWLAGAPLERVLCVTGTKGKSTTTAIAGHLLERLGHRCLTAGNLGVPPWDPALPGDLTHWVVEVSSYQAADLTVSPPVVGVTSLHPDHLDWHGSVERYYADKLSLCTRPGAAVTVAAGTPGLRAEARRLGPEVRWVSAHDGARWASSLGLLGAHNLTNAGVARRCLDAMGERLPPDATVLAELAAGFVPLPSRLRPIARIGGVDFVDDSLSTNVLPTVAALDAFAERRVALLVGGFDRGLDYGPLADHLRSRRQSTLVLTLPDNGPAIAQRLEAADGPGDYVQLWQSGDMDEATRLGFEWARPDGVVLLSPAAPSFGRYRDYRERAAAFVAAAADCADGV